MLIFVGGGQYSQFAARSRRGGWCSGAWARVAPGAAARRVLPGLYTAYQHAHWVSALLLPFTTSPAIFSASAPGCMLQAPKLRVRTRHGTQHLRCWPLRDIICLQLVALLRPARSFRARISVSGCASSQRTHTRKWIPMHTHTHALSALHANWQIGRGYSGRGIARG